MRRHSFPIGILAVTCGLLANAAPAQSASNQTWVSASGNNAGTCSASAPCRTFQFALGVTNAGGVISVLSSGEFGPVIINKSISIMSDGVEGAIFKAAGDAGITVDGSGIEVSLRGLTIDLSGSAKHGIHFVAGSALHVQNCVVRRTQDGIRFRPNAGTSELYVSDSVITHTSAQGINVNPAGGAGAKVMLERVRVENAGNIGMAFIGVGGSINATVRDSVSAGNQAYGIYAVGSGASPVNVMVDRTASVNNSGIGIQANGATIRIGDSTITGNNYGLSAPGSGSVIASFGTNKVSGNTNDGVAPTTVAYK